MTLQTLAFLLIVAVFLFGCQGASESENGSGYQNLTLKNVTVNETVGPGESVVIPEPKWQGNETEAKPICGNGKIERGEECDPQMNGSEVSGACQNGDICVDCKCVVKAEKTETFCGDGTIQKPNSKGTVEECENGTDTCSAGKHCEYSECRCLLNKTYCGDAMVQRPNSLGAYEECEIGVKCNVRGMECNESLCACMPKCGDGICLTVCDPGCQELETYASCPKDCPPLCGDGICQPEENYTNCSIDCEFKPYTCGNGILDGMEQCETNVSCAPYQSCNMTSCKCMTPDSDNDGFPDYLDNCPLVKNNQVDLDGDGIGDPCDSVPLDCSRQCMSYGYPLVGGSNMTREACNSLAKAEVSGCTAFCTNVFFWKIDFGWNSGYSCCCEKTVSTGCDNCPGPNATCTCS